MRRVVVYTRSGCTLCEQAEQLVTELAAGIAEVELVDVDADPALHERYTVRVPVVAVDGVELFDYEVDAEALRVALTR